MIRKNALLCIDTFLFLGNYISITLHLPGLFIHYCLYFSELTGEGSCFFKRGTLFQTSLYYHRFQGTRFLGIVFEWL
jgi:hypothetical protein